MLKKINRFIAKKRLLRRYKYLIEVDKIMEGFVTKTILDGGSAEFIAASRKQLLTLQNDIGSKERLINYLNKIK